jgi:hypothetical protein
MILRAREGKGGCDRWPVMGRAGAAGGYCFRFLLSRISNLMVDTRLYPRTAPQSAPHFLRLVELVEGMHVPLSREAVQRKEPREWGRGSGSTPLDTGWCKGGLGLWGHTIRHTQSTSSRPLWFLRQCAQSQLRETGDGGTKDICSASPSAAFSENCFFRQDVADGS